MSRRISRILTAGFSEFGTDRPLTEEQASEMSGPFNVTLGGVIWRIVNSDMADYIEESADPTSNNYLKVSASWELGFTDYNIVELAAEEKNIEDGNIISDQKLVKRLENKLKALGGDGVLDNGNKIYRHVINDVIPLGIGLTESPAAEVSGIVTESAKEDMDPISQELKNLREKVAMLSGPHDGVSLFLPTNEEAQEIAANKSTEYTKEKEENFSQTEEKDVSQFNRGSNMKVTSIKQITDESLKELSASAVSEFIEEELKTASEHYSEEKTKLEDSLKASQEAQERLEGEHKVAQEELEKVKTVLDELQAEKTERAAQDAFNERMATMDETYELDNEDRQVIASQIKDIDEEAFAKYLENMKVLLSSKDKETLKEQSKKAEKATEETKASDEHENVVEEALDKAEQIKEEIPVSATASDPEVTVYDKYKKAFDVENWSLGKR